MRTAGPMGFFNSCWGMIMGCFAGLNVIGKVLYLLLLTIVAITMIVIGALYLRSCPAQNMIPIYLIVFGVILIVTFFLITYPTFDSIIWLFLFIWFIAGCYWVYSIYQPSDSACNTIVYMFAFWLNNLIFIILGVLFLASCIMCFTGVPTVATVEV